MAKVQKNFRFDSDFIERYESYAKARGITANAAIVQLVNAGLESEVSMATKENADKDTIRLLGEHIRDLREMNSTLRGQLAEKDRQIERTLHVAENAQLLEGVQVAGKLGESVTNDSEPRSVWERLWARVGSKR